MALSSNLMMMMMPPSTIFEEQNPLFEYSPPTQLQPNHFSNYDDLFFHSFDGTSLNENPQEIYTHVVENPLFESFITLEDHELISNPSGQGVSGRRFDYFLNKNELMSNRFLKRQRCYYEDSINNNALMGNYYYMKTPSFKCYDFKQPQVVVPPPLSNFAPPQYFRESLSTSLSNTNNTTEGCNSKERERSVTAQSIAARTRRRKIKDKTVELRELIPGERNKMNSTAEMLHAAFKYVKFMQSQIGILRCMPSLQDSEAKQEGFGQNTLEELVKSEKIQDKLSSMEKCLVPINYVKELAKDGSFPLDSDTSLNKLLALD